MREIPVIQPGGDSTGVVSGHLGVAAQNLPTLADGSRPKWVYVFLGQPAGSSPASGTISFGDATVALPSFTDGIGLGSRVPGIIINVSGTTHYRVISSYATGVEFTITPLAGVVQGG